MMRLQLSLVGARAAFAGMVVCLAVAQFLGSPTAATLQQLWEQYLGRLPFGPVSDFLVTHTGLAIALAILAAPTVSAVFGQGSRSLVWLIVGAFVLMAPAALSTSWIDWFRFLGDDAARNFDSAGTSTVSGALAVLGATLALFLLWQTDRLQTDVARLRSLGMGARDTLRYVAGHIASTAGVALGAILMASVAGVIAAAVVTVAGDLDPRSWVSLGAVIGGLFAIAVTIAAIGTARSR